MFPKQNLLMVTRWKPWILLILFLASCQVPADPPVNVSENGGQSEQEKPLDSPEPLPSLTPTQMETLLAQRTDTPAPSPTATFTPTASSSPTTTLLFTGVIVPARCVQAAIDEAGDSDYLYDEVREMINQADLAVGTLNATISDYPPRTGCVPTYILVGGSENADAMARAGFDLMSVATNHIKNCGLSNCGDQAFFDTLENLNRVGIIPVGAGQDLQEAMKPVVIEKNGVRFGFVSLGQLEPNVFATDDTPGIAVLDEENLRVAIDAAKQVSDVVIVLPHWGPEDVPNPNWSQRDLARVAVDAGADLVVGNHTHVVQAIETVDEVPVFYGLGNFVFDQNWARDHQQGVILLVTFQGTELIDYQFIPTHVDFDGRVHIADPEEAEEILLRIQEASQALP
jgi:poly-gamma-glutamate synthesis protein (capsule biosynthesis protein)